MSTELTFDKESSRRSWFKIMPSSPDLNEGDPVVSGAGVLFEHQLTECALVVSDSVLSSGIFIILSFFPHFARFITS